MKLFCSLAEPERYPDASMETAENFSRNPGNPEPLFVADGPWCYVDDSFVEWEHCDIPLCDGKTPHFFKENPCHFNRSVIKLYVSRNH